MSSVLILQGNILFCKNLQKLEVHNNSFLVCVDGLVHGIFDKLPEEFASIPVKNCSNKLIIPGLVDLHVHAPQYSFRATGMDLELIDWLNAYAFPEEAKYVNIDYAKKAYGYFIEDLLASPTTRASIFATLHIDSVILLMELLEKTALKTFVGKVNMDRNTPSYLCETTDQSIENTKLWIKTAQSFKNTKPILTPRFTPACTDTLMKELGKIQKEYNLPVQSHLSENYGEIEWVKNLCPKAKHYADSYHQQGLFGENSNTIMAHCVHCTEDEVKLMKKNGVFIAHCPQSNTNIASGIAPVRSYLENGLQVGLGTDVAGGTSLNMFRAMADVVQVSKLRWRLVDQKLKPLTLNEVFFLATKGGGKFFGKVGSFENGYEADALILDDSNLKSAKDLSPEQRLERLLYLGTNENVVEKFVAGVQVK